MRSVTMIFLMVLLTLGLAAEHNTTQLMNEGLKAEMQKDWPEAISLYRRIVKEEPKREDIWLRMADIYAAQKDINGMIDALSHAVKIKPDNTVLYSRLASAYAVKKDSKNAYEAIKKALEIDPSNRDYLSRYALLAEENKDWDSAVSAYRKLLQNDPERADIWKRIRDIEAVRKNLPGVIEALQKQIALEPGNAALYYELARAYSMNKQTTKALSAIKKAVALDPENETYIRMEADLAEWSGEPKSRLDAYAALLKKDPSNADVWLDRARTLVPLSRYRDAIDSYRHYLSLKPSDLKVWLELAYVQKSHMSTASAVKSLEKAIRLNGLIHHRGVGKKRALPDVDIPILEYHCVGKGYKDRYHIDPAEFDRQMRVLREKGYKSITVSELYDALYGQKKLPEKPVVLTFDDGCRESYSTIYPILKKHGMKGEFYLITYLVAESEAQRQQRVRSSAIRGEGKHTSGYLLWNEVRKMAKGGMAFGSHTATHIDMQEANLNEAAYQLLYSKIAMKRYGGIDVTDFSYPYGKGAFRTAIHRLLRKYGYLTAVAAHGGIEKSGSLQAYNIRRIEIYGADTSHPGVSVHAAATSPESFFAKIATSEAETYYARAEWYTGIEGKQKLAEEAIGKAVALEPDNPR
ncbi:MAG: polysaccharide deacetylase family protein, partial [Sulfurovum sp.]|nr:polysaccharide deacetylase family protein [Sulfurovum sp.]